MIEREKDGARYISDMDDTELLYGKVLRVFDRDTGETREEHRLLYAERRVGPTSDVFGLPEEKPYALVWFEGNDSVHMPLGMFLGALAGERPVWGGCFDTHGKRYAQTLLCEFRDMAEDEWRDFLCGHVLERTIKYTRTNTVLHSSRDAITDVRASDRQRGCLQVHAGGKYVDTFDMPFLQTLLYEGTATSGGCEYSLLQGDGKPEFN